MDNNQTNETVISTVDALEPDQPRLKRAADHPFRVITALVVLASVATGAHWWLATMPPVPETAPQITPEVPVEPEVLSSDEQPNYHFSTFDQFDISAEVGAVNANIESDVTAYLTHKIPTPVPDDAPPFYADEAQFSESYFAVDIYDGSQFPGAAVALQQMESDMEKILSDLTMRYVPKALPPALRSFEVKTVPLEVDYTIPPREVVRAYLIADLMALWYPLEADTYNENVRQFAEAATGYGHYLNSDINAAETLVNQYWELFKQSQTYQALLESTVVTN